MTHELKTIQPYFSDVVAGAKLFEVRLDDRGYSLHDQVILKEYDAETCQYSGREIYVTITYILRNFHAIKEGYIVFGFEIVDMFLDARQHKENPTTKPQGGR